MLVTLLGMALSFVADDELKAQLLSEYRLLTTHPAAAAGLYFGQASLAPAG